MSSNLYLLVLLATAILAAPQSGKYEDDCKLPNCHKSSTQIPNNLNKTDIPQIVYLTFDDAVQTANYDFYVQAFNNRKNPDGCPISATFFISHEYTNYSMVHDLYQNGHEIALHSITHTSASYWKDASVELFKKEFGGEREIFVNFAGIPNEHIYGIRIPFLQMSGDNSTQALKQLALEYDCSWPTQTYRNPGLWPYTLDYPSRQDCPIGPCPEMSIPGLWVQPMIDMIDNSKRPCAMADACVDVPSTVDGIFDFMVKNFEVQYNGNRAPFGFYVHAAWFVLDNNRFLAYLKFLDYLGQHSDVYVVNVHRGLQWVKNPQPLQDLKKVWPECNKPKPSACERLNCRLRKGEEERLLPICGQSCPKNYPWLDNPLGN